MRITQAEETWKNRTHHKCSRNLFIILGNCELAIYISSYIRTTYRLPTRGQSKVSICIAKKYSLELYMLLYRCRWSISGGVVLRKLWIFSGIKFRRIVPTPLLCGLGEKIQFNLLLCTEKIPSKIFLCVDLTKGQLSQRLRINVVWFFKLHTWGVANKICVKPSLPRTFCFKQKDLKTYVYATVNLT